LRIEKLYSLVVETPLGKIGAGFLCGRMTFILLAVKQKTARLPSCFGGRIED